MVHILAEVQTYAYTCRDARARTRPGGCPGVERVLGRNCPPHWGGVCPLGNAYPCHGLSRRLTVDGSEGRVSGGVPANKRPSAPSTVGRRDRPWHGYAFPSGQTPPQCGGQFRPNTRSTPGHPPGRVRARASRQVYAYVCTSARI